MARKRNRSSLVPGSRPGLDALKLQVAREVGAARRQDTAARIADSRSYRQVLEDLKLEVAEELGVGPIVAARGWAELPSRVNGAIGGRLGGQIGGRMVRRMIDMAERDLAAHPRTGL
ncbi:MAG TPA: alpha/beta-type small acid-soluble spore protein [Bacillota bacterium]|nr:acid-soluble spore protein [Clostridiales bacterium]HSW10288.1 alpha/beta-type small acid-soluble spore protein [Bacillota bacterium]